MRSDYVEVPDDPKLIEIRHQRNFAWTRSTFDYMDPKNFRDMEVQTRGDFGGLGIEVTMEDGLVKVVTPIDETPAAKAGILANDIITKIGDDEVQGMTMDRRSRRCAGQ